MRLLSRLCLDTGHDLHFALRTLRRSPGFAATAIVTLALGIGANTTVFSIADAVLLKMLPVPEPERLLQLLQPEVPPSRSVGEYFPGRSYRDRFSFAEFREMQRVVAPFAGLIADTPPNTTEALIDGAEETIRHSVVSGNYFDVLGIKPILGRVTNQSIDNERGRHPDAVISYGFWKRRFALDQAALGHTLQIGNTRFQIIGVIKEGFFGLQVGSMVDIWTPLAMASEGFLRGASRVRLVARLRPEVTASQTMTPLQLWYKRAIGDRFGGAAPGSNLSRFASTAQLKATPAAKGISPLRDEYRESIGIVFAVVGVVLLLVCANVANLLLARASVRHREMAVRRSLGAGRFRLVRQLLTESLLLTVVAATCGALVAHWTVPVLVSLLAPSATPIQLPVSLDSRVFWFVAAVALFTTILCGMIPALRASGVDLNSALKSGNPSVVRRHAWQSKILVVSQTALSLALLVISTLFVRTLMNLKTLDAGFDRDNVVLATVQFRNRATDDHLYIAWRELLRRVSAIPGVEAASTSIGGPLMPPRRAGEPRIANAPWDDSLPVSWFVPVSSNYFRTFGGSLIRGRDFEPRDFEPASLAVAIINQTMARRFFGEENPIGKKLNDYGPNPPSDAQMLEIVGVASDMKFDSLRNEPPPMVYLPFTQKGSPLKVGVDIMGLSLRTRQDSGSLQRALRRELAATSPAFTLRSITTQAQIVDDTLIRERLLATVGSFFGFLALILACVGIYGTMSYSVARRTQEIGIRMALGAGWQRVIQMVLGEALVTVALGCLIGLSVGFFAARIIAGLLFGLEPGDPATVMLALGVLTTASLIAAFVPALRACRTSPMNALRTE